jgi:selenide,water dikinase
VLLGGEGKCREAGCMLVGGHSVDDPELKFGLAVTGTVVPGRVVRNSTARPGDRLVLTKPLGSGVLATALKKGDLPAAEAAELVRWLSELNAAAATAMVDAGAHAATDVTGFGLFGHALEMAAGGSVRLAFEAAHLPLLPGAERLAGGDYLTGGGRRNRDWVGERLVVEGRPAAVRIELGFDPQTSGGLLIALAPEAVGPVLERLPAAVEVGWVAAGEPAVVVKG